MERARLQTGSLLKLRTGSGVWHAEGIGEDELREGKAGTEMRGVLFWVNLGWFSVIPDGSLKSLVLPAVTLGLIASSIVARLVRSAMLEVLGQEYVQTARAKGLTERRVVLHHALRNAAIPVVTIVGLQFGGLLTGAFIIEAVFAWHGIGELAVQAFAKRDFPMIQGITLVVATTYVLVNLVVDIIYAALDPRITYS